MPSLKLYMTILADRCSVKRSLHSPFLTAPGLSDPRPVVTNLSTYQLTRMMVIHDMHRTYKKGESKHKP